MIEGYKEQKTKYGVELVKEEGNQLEESKRIFKSFQMHRMVLGLSYPVFLITFSLFLIQSQFNRTASVGELLCWYVAIVVPVFTMLRASMNATKRVVQHTEIVVESVKESKK